jgi:hypothetical protein
MFWYVYSDARALEGKPKLGDGNCVALVQKLTNVGYTGFWSPGLRVMDCVHLAVGCVIATFEQGRYANRATGNHACLFLEFGPVSQTTGKPVSIIVMDQWNPSPTRPPRPFIQSRAIWPRGKSFWQGNPFPDSENADTFYVVNHLPSLP